MRPHTDHGQPRYAPLPLVARVRPSSLPPHLSGLGDLGFSLNPKKAIQRHLGLVKKTVTKPLELAKKTTAGTVSLIEKTAQRHVGIIKKTHAFNVAMAKRHAALVTKPIRDIRSGKLFHAQSKPGAAPGSAGSIQYVDENGNPIDPSQLQFYVDENGNPLAPPDSYASDANYKPVAPMSASGATDASASLAYDPSLMDSAAANAASSDAAAEAPAGVPKAVLIGAAALALLFLLGNRKRGRKT